ncbi:MAG: hydrogenase 3 maturation endopeptidase HyCI [Planctomycetota bacterium]|jgi:hydrogenase 3 maturation protease
MNVSAQLVQRIKKLKSAETLILGIGNRLKGDDAVGPLVCDLLKEHVSAHIIDAGTVPENYIFPILKLAPKNLLIIDAVDFSAEPGCVDIFDIEKLNVHAISTHSVSPRLFIDVLRSNIPLDVYLIGIQPAGTQLGQDVSPEVSEAIGGIVDVLCEIFG